MFNKPTHQVALVGQRIKSTPEDVRSMPMSGVGTLNDGQVVLDSGDGKRCLAMNADTQQNQRMIGLVVHQHIGKNGRDSQGNEAYQQYDVVPVMVAGRMWVRATDHIQHVGGKVYVRNSSPTDEQPIGSLQANAEHGIAFAGATWDSLRNADGLAMIKLTGV